MVLFCFVLFVYFLLCFCALPVVGVLAFWFDMVGDGLASFGTVFRTILFLVWLRLGCMFRTNRFFWYGMVWLCFGFRIRYQLIFGFGMLSKRFALGSISRTI